MCSASLKHDQTIRHSSYYDYDKFNELIVHKNDHFSVLSTNIQSINSKFNELEAFVEELGNTNFKFSVICLTLPTRFTEQMEP